VYPDRYGLRNFTYSNFIIAKVADQGRQARGLPSAEVGYEMLLNSYIGLFSIENVDIRPFLTLFLTI
jgi:hypothetical protein